MFKLTKLYSNTHNKTSSYSKYINNNKIQLNVKKQVPVQSKINNIKYKPKIVNYVPKINVPKINVPKIDVPLDLTQINKDIQLPKYSSVIPLNIFQTWKTLDLPLKMKENVELLKLKNPEFKYHLYDDIMCREFIKNNFNNDVLYTFDKLKPGAFKADLWRYCILYIHGGIYLDIKYNCTDNFKLIELTDKEYFVRDRLHCGINGIYNALLICMPYNTILYDCINLTVKNVKNNIYGDSELHITGPHMLSTFFNEIDILNLKLSFSTCGIYILFDNNPILKIYNEYRSEQNQLFLNSQTDTYDIINTEINKYYKLFWLDKDVYNFPTLKSNKSINYNKTIQKNINGNNILFYSSTPTIIKLTPDSYLINIRWVNYSYNKNGSKKYIPDQWLTLNSRFTVDLNFNKINNEIFLEENFGTERNFWWGIGLEDIRIFNYNNIYYYIATYFDTKRAITSMASSIYNISNENYELNKNIILPTIYDTNKHKIYEKNWVFVNYKNKLSIVYKWFPLQIGQIDYVTQKMNIIDIKYNIPDYFKDTRGSSCGYIYNDEIWFVLHKCQYSNTNNTYNYQHFFAIFDLNMNLKKYSELFKLRNETVEFCVGLIIHNNNIILSYSVLDTESIISEYNLDYIKNSIKWY